MARRAWLEPDDVINTFPADRLRAALKPRELTPLPLAFYGGSPRGLRGAPAGQDLVRRFADGTVPPGGSSNGSVHRGRPGLSCVPRRDRPQPTMFGPPGRPTSI
jgi:hypothetical protein